MRQRAGLSISSMSMLKKRNHVDFVAVVLSAYVGANVGRFLRGVFAVGTAESRQLSAFELHVRIQVVLPAEDARAFWARVLVPGLNLQAGWQLEATQVYQVYICKKTFELVRVLKRTGHRQSVAHNGTRETRDIKRAKKITAINHEKFR